MSHSAREKLTALHREVAFRRRVYDRRVGEGKMSRKMADYEIGIFEDIAADYEKLAEGERLL